MTSAATLASQEPKARTRASFATTALNTSATFWFLTAVVGQWIFALYIGIVYGTTTAHGNFAAWNKILPHGYVPGNTFANVLLATHLLLASVITFGGPLQLIPQIRTRYPVFHRYLGRTYIPVAFLMGLSGLYLLLSGRQVVGDFSQHLCTAINGLLILAFAALAWRTAMARNFAAHRLWATRLYLAVNGVWFFRVMLMFWLMVNKGPVGFDMKTFTGPALTLIGIFQFALPPIVFELYWRTQSKGTPPQRLLMSAALITLTLIMATGIIAATMGMWLPQLNAVLASSSKP